MTIATIFSYAANEDDPEDVLQEEGFDTDALDQTSRDFLESAIQDYNAAFNTNFDTSSDKFQNYYKDLSMRVKNREVDLLIVVNMFLTGFDATTLNTLWVDKNLKMHGLIQAYSRTNRILNSVKTYGNIVCFRDLQKATDDAIALFGDKNASASFFSRASMITGTDMRIATVSITPAILNCLKNWKQNILWAARLSVNRQRKTLSDCSALSSV